MTFYTVYLTLTMVIVARFLPKRYSNSVNAVATLRFLHRTDNLFVNFVNRSFSTFLRCVGIRRWNMTSDQDLSVPFTPLMRKLVCQPVKDVVHGSQRGHDFIIMFNLFVPLLLRSLLTLLKKSNIACVVQEFLSYASSQHLQALSLRPDLLAYFHTRCSLCQHFCVTTRGLLTHLQSAHNDLFRRHEAHNQHLLSLCDFQSPCVFCGVAYKQYHKCLLLRQLAMLLTRDGVEVPAGVSAESLTCPICRKAYTTKHGLQRHLREYHQATEDCNQMDDTFIDFQCHLYEAVQSNRCADLLQLAEVQSFLATWCILCNRQFSRRQELSRHFKHNHSQ